MSYLTQWRFSAGFFCQSHKLLIHFPEIQRRYSCDLTEHGDKVAGIGEAHSSGNILDFHVRIG